MKRRDATHIIGALGLSLIAAPGALAQLTESLASFNTLEETFLAFEKLSEICWSLSQGNDLELAERVLWTYLPKVKALALPPSGQQQTVARIASQGYLLAASLSGNRNDLKARLHFSEQALMFANIAQDSNLQIAALRQLANTFDYLGCSDKVLQTYQQALPYLNEASPLLRARIYAGAAGSYAERGRKQDALRFLSLAYESFPENPQTDVSFRFADCGYYTLVLWEGLTQLELHQPEEAEKAFARADGLNTKIQIPGRVRAELLSSQATMFTELRRMDEACCYLQDAVKLSVAIGSTRRFHEAQSVFAQMKAIWGKEKSVKDLEDLFLA